MNTTYRIALEDDWPRLSEYDPRGHEFGFPTVLAERDNAIVGLMASRPGRRDQIECHAIKANTSFVALRLMEAYESILRAFEIPGYCFTVEKEERVFWAAIERLPETRQYGESETHIHGLRMLNNA
jgi:hypothetical protein